MSLQKYPRICFPTHESCASGCVAVRWVSASNAPAPIQDHGRGARLSMHHKSTTPVTPLSGAMQQVVDLRSQSPAQPQGSHSFRLVKVTSQIPAFLRLSRVSTAHTVKSRALDPRLAQTKPIVQRKALSSPHLAIILGIVSEGVSLQEKKSYGRLAKVTQLRISCGKSLDELSESRAAIIFIQEYGLFVGSGGVESDIIRGG